MADNDTYIERPNLANDAKLVTPMNKHATMLTGARRHQQARDTTKTRINFTNATSARKKRGIAVNFKQLLAKMTGALFVQGAAAVAQDLAPDVLVEAGAELIPVIAILGIGRRILRGERRPWDRRRLVLAVVCFITFT